MNQVAAVTWNIEWRRAGSPHGQIVRERISQHDPEVICLTEAPADFLADAGHTITSHPDYGYPIEGNRRKVLLWSKSPWHDVDDLGHDELPSGRFVAGRTETPIGSLLVIGVCIPWDGAHVTSGRRDRTRWEDHGRYIQALGDVLTEAEGPALLMGDFNQTVPRTRAPRAMHEALVQALVPRFELATAGDFAPIQRRSIDHVAHTSDLSSSDIESISNVGPDGERLSDHFGVASRICRAGAS